MILIGNNNTNWTGDVVVHDVILGHELGSTKENQVKCRSVRQLFQAIVDSRLLFSCLGGQVNVQWSFLVAFGCAAL